MTESNESQSHAEAFAAEVRDAMRALPADVVRDLTDGLESGIAASLADGGTLPNATEYARDLMRAAQVEFPAERKPMVAWVDRASAAAKSILGWFRSLAPAWWVLRGWVITQLIGVMLVFGEMHRVVMNHWNDNWWFYPVFLLVTVLSVELGRGRVRLPRIAVGALNLALVIPTIFMLGANTRQQDFSSLQYQSPQTSTPLSGCVPMPKMEGMALDQAQAIIDSLRSDYGKSVGLADMDGKPLNVENQLPRNFIITYQSPQPDAYWCDSKVTLYLTSINSTSPTTSMP